MMLVILLGHIDLSVPWTLTAAAMMATAVGGPCGDPGRDRRRPRRRPRQRPRRRLSARALDDLHARRQRRDARPHGRPYRRLRAADRGDRPDAAISPSGASLGIPVALFVWLAVSASSS